MLGLEKCRTIDLELAQKGNQNVVIYKVSPLDTAIAKWIFRINLPYYSFPNLILNRSRFPELISPKLTDKNLFEAVTTLLEPKKLRAYHLERSEERRVGKE